MPYLGYKNLYTYNVADWAKDESLPMESYENYEMIVPATIVNDVLLLQNHFQLLAYYSLFQVHIQRLSKRHFHHLIPLHHKIMK